MADINLVELVQQTIGEFEERFEQRRLELVQGLPEDALIIRADGRRLWRVLENLYTNAFKVCNGAQPGLRGCEGRMGKGQFYHEKCVGEAPEYQPERTDGTVCAGRCVQNHGGQAAWGFPLPRV